MYQENQIREALCSRPAGLTLTALALGCAVWQVEPDRQSHYKCLDMLPSFIEAEADGKLHTVEFMYTQRHLHICASCAKMYSDLVRLTAGMAEPLSVSRIPPPELSFLDGPRD